VSIAFLWIPATLIAAAAQTARNTMQSSLTARIGIAGATQVRFLFGFPFALLFLGLLHAISGEAVPQAQGRFLAFCAAGAVAQIAATAMMLAAMRERSFAVTTAYLKTEPVQVAVFGVLVLGDPLTAMGLLAVLIATAGVVVMALKPGIKPSAAGLRPALLGLAAGSFFALAAIGFRGAILSLGEAGFVMRSTTTLAWSLGIQSALLLVWLGLFDRSALTCSLSAWRGSVFAGFMGAFASQFWFFGFALTSAANVRTLALVEVIFAQIVSRQFFAQTISSRDWIGMGLIVAGVALLLGKVW
jgi:drug/metabolite transporter (DMT)-like permease